MKRTFIYDKDDEILEKIEQMLQEITLGKGPIMVNSKFCINSMKDKSQLDECKYDNRWLFLLLMELRKVIWLPRTLY